jgi:hypothetical protein
MKKFIKPYYRRTERKKGRAAMEVVNYNRRLRLEGKASFTFSSEDQRGERGAALWRSWTG